MKLSLALAVLLAPFAHGTTVRGAKTRELGCTGTGCAVFPDYKTLYANTRVYLETPAEVQDPDDTTLEPVVNTDGAVVETSKQDVIDKYGPIGEWQFSDDVDSLALLFEDAVSFNEDISGWDVSKIKHFNNMFQNAHSFNKELGYVAADAGTDASGWDMASAENLQGMFAAATAFNNGQESGVPGIMNWDVEKVTNFNSMFTSASSFNQDISGWAVTCGVDFTRMFMYASSYQQNLCDWKHHNNDFHLLYTGLVNTGNFFHGTLCATTANDQLCFNCPATDPEPSTVTCPAPAPGTAPGIAPDTAPGPAPGQTPAPV